MTRTIHANEIQQFVMQIFGNREITAIANGNSVILTAAERENVNQSIMLNKLCGMFKNTTLLSSDDFAREKEQEKKLEEEKFKHE